MASTVAIVAALMEQNFGKSAPFSLGVEEEFQILNSESHELVSRIDEILPAFEGTGRRSRSRPSSSSRSSRSPTDVAATVGEAMEERPAPEAVRGLVEQESGSLLAVAEWLARETVHQV